MKASYIYDMARVRGRRNSNKEALVEWKTGKRFTYGDLDHRARAMGSFLVNELGVEKGDRVGFCCPNELHMLDALYATYDTGAILVTYNHRLRAEELIELACRERPKVLFYDSKSEEKARAIFDALNGDCTLVSLESNPCVQAELNVSVIDSYADVPFDRRPFEIDDPQLLIHTGGTTGLPKAAVLSYRSVFMNSMTEILSWQLGRNDVGYIAMPLYHTAGWNVFFLPLLFMGGKVVLCDEFSPESFYQILESERPTGMMLADSMLRGIVSDPRFADADFSSFNFIVGGGGPVAVSSKRPFWEKGVRVYNGYGMSETGPNNVSPDVWGTLEECMRKPDIVGKPFACTEVRVVNELGNDVAQGEIGEVWMRGELTCSGYWGLEAETRNVFHEDWLKTGDMGFLDDDGDLTLCGRSKNMYISGGENVFPVEIEAKLEEHPGIKEACVFGVPSEQWGEVGKALLVQEGQACVSEDDVRMFMKNSLSTIKRPHYYEFVPSIPRNSAGKRDEKTIKQLYGNL